MAKTEVYQALNGRSGVLSFRNGRFKIFIGHSSRVINRLLKIGGVRSQERGLGEVYI